MPKFIRKLLLLIVISSSILISNLHVYALEEDEHDAYLEQVLFGIKDFEKGKSDEINNAITSLKYASYLAIDQFNAKTHKNDQTKLDHLKKRRIPSVPSLKSIDFSSNSIHRKYTHKGWDFEYGKSEEDDEDLANWNRRKKLLINTVNKELNFDYTGFLWFKEYDPRGKSFAAIIYYVHILGDHIAVKWPNTSALQNLIHLADKHDKEYSLIKELEKHLKIVFENQKRTNVYRGLMNGIKLIDDEACEVIHSEGGLNTEEKLKTYNECAKDLMKLLIERVPTLLKNESFFADVFYAN